MKKYILETTNGPKRWAKKLRRAADLDGYDVRLTWCQQLIAKALGYPHWNALAAACTVAAARGVDDGFRDAQDRLEALLRGEGLGPEAARRAACAAFAGAGTGGSSTSVLARRPAPTARRFPMM